MAKKPERGLKAEWIRNGIAANPGLGPTELAELLNTKAQHDKVRLEFKPGDISNAKQQMKKGGAAPTGRQGRTRQGAASGSPGEAVAKLLEASKVLGKEEAKKILDLV
jgi:hypothetical protein